MSRTDDRIIDLGYTDPHLDYPDRLESEPPYRDEVGRLRRVGLAALALACMAALGGAARPPVGVLTHTSLITWPRGIIGEGGGPTPMAGLLMAQFAGEVLAYHPDGRPAWRSRPFPDLTGEQDFFHLSPWGDSILLARVTQILSSHSERTSKPVVVALDPATGRERWRMAGYPQPAGELAMVMDEVPNDGREDLTGWRIYRSLPDGLVWTIPPVRMVAVEPETDTLMTLTGDGLLTEYELSTGTPRRSGRLPLPPIGTEADEALDGRQPRLILQLLRDRLIVQTANYPALGPLSLSYDRATLLPIAPSLVDRLHSVAECGPVVCGHSFEHLYILDRDTLAELWRTAQSDLPVWTGHGLLSRWPRPRLLDERTGEARIDLQGWQTVGEAQPPFGRRAETFPLVIQRLDRRTFVARMTPNGIRVLGSIPQLVTECQHHEGLLACTRLDGRTEVWRLREPDPVPGG